ncbi:MAG: hypothetical protein ACK5Y2_04625 [Bdellovibrionales bacterium]
MKTLALLIALLIGSNSRALANTGSTKGNGGFVVSCQGAEGPSYHTLDLFEAERTRKFKLLKFSESKAVDIAMKVVAQLETVSPRRSRLYQKQIREFYSRSAFVRNAVFTDVKDAYPVYLPRFCKLVPAAIQTRYALPEEARYFINEEVWKKLSPVHQAALMVHEIVYWEFAHEYSVLTRAFVGLLFSRHFFELYATPTRFFDLLVLMKAPYYEQNGFLIDLEAPVERYPESPIIKSGRLLPGSLSNEAAEFHFEASDVNFYRSGFPIALKLDDSKQSFHTLPCIGTTLLKNLFDGKVHFYKNGGLWKTGFVMPFSGLQNSCPQLHFDIDTEEASEWMEDHEYAGYTGILEFSPQGSVYSTRGLRATVRQNQGVSEFTLRGKIEYWDGLRPLSGILEAPATLTSPFGPLHAEGQRPVRLFSDGKVQCGTAQKDHFFEDEHRLYRIHAGQEFCFQQ